GWQKGISSAVRLAAMTPARMAVSNTGPLRVRCPLALRASATMRGRRTRASASAIRCVTALLPTSTIVGRSRASRCVRRAPRSTGRRGRAGLRAAIASAPEVIHLGVLHAARAQLIAQLAVAVETPLPDGAHQLAELGVTGAGAQRRAQVHALGCEQAGMQFAVGGEPCPRAVSAERLRHRGNEADLATAVFEDIAAGHLAAIVGIDRTQRPARVDAREQLLRGHHALALPVVAVAYVHVLDEAHDDVGAAKALDQIQHPLIVDPALYDGVDLDG